MKRVFAFGLALCAIIMVSSCGETDPCLEVNCVNGDCADGSCACEKGYGGTLCDEELAPQFVRVSSIVVRNFPEIRSSGEFWDDDDESGADLMVRVQDNSKVYHEITDVVGVVKENAKANTNYVFETDFKVDKLDNNIVLELRDYDPSGDNFETSYQFVFSIKFKMGEQIAGFPSVIKLIGTGDKAEVDLNVSYAF